MKKVICLVLVFLMVLASVPCLAEEVVSREALFDEIEALAKNEGLSVFREGANLTVTGGKSIAVWGDKITYRKDGRLVVESIYCDGTNVKYPTEAIETVFGNEIPEKTETPEYPFVFECVDDKIIITGLKKDVSEIVIPGEINGKKVEIGPNAFAKSALKKVVLDERIKKISEYAFYNCTKLEEINLENVEELGYCAFWDCKSLKEINLLNIKRWDGLPESRMNEEGTRVNFDYQETLFRYNVYVPRSVFSNAKIDNLRIKWPEENFDEGAKTFPSLFLGCEVETVIFENFTVSPSLAEFKTLGQFAANPRWQSGVDLIQKNADLVIYSKDERVKEYAEKIGVKFEVIAPFEYTVNDGKVLIDKYTGTGGKVVIPDEIEGLPVTKINAEAFSGCTGIEEIVIPDSVNYIHGYTFTGSVIKRVVLGKNVQEVFDSGFSYCKIEELVVLSPHTKMHYSGREIIITGHGQKKDFYKPGSFEGSEIGTIYAPLGSVAESYAKENDIKFVPIEEDIANIFFLEEKEECVLIKGLTKEVSDLVIPGEINGKKVEIDFGAFEKSGVINVKIENGVEVIPAGAFRGCEALVSVAIGDVKKIGGQAFYNCKKLNKINLENVEEMGASVFTGCDSLESVTLLNLKTWEGIEDGQLTGKDILPLSYNRYLYTYDQQRIKFSPFYNCEGLREVTIKWPETEKESFPTLFTGCRNLRRVNFNNYTAKPCDGEFYSVMLVTHRFDSDGHNLYKRHDDLTIYCEDERAKEYADKIGVKFEKIGDTSNDLVSIKELEKYGITYTIGSGNNAIEAVRGDTHLYFYTGELRAFVNGETVVWEKAATGYYPDYYVPIEDVLKAFGLKIEFNHETNEVEVIEE